MYVCVNYASPLVCSKDQAEMDPADMEDVEEVEEEETGEDSKGRDHCTCYSP